MPQPTPEQQTILDDATRVRLVRAAPGSGKTWLIAEDVRRRCFDWCHKHAGMAVISFTNVARDEIVASVGSVLNHPHFVGTIDAFVFQYIVRPFAHVFDPGITTPRLVPAPVADSLNEKQSWHSSSLSVAVGPNPKTDHTHLFKINAVGLEDNVPVYRATYGVAGNEITISGKKAQAILDLKRKVWSKSGCMSHSDVTYLASEILHNPQYGNIVRGLITRRFPILVVDELQDTGYYLARTLYQLVALTNMSSLLVGDPDQAIYEFNGARPDLFAKFESIAGARVFPMRQTQRCAVQVCNVCDALCESGAKTVANAGHSGAVVLISHSDTPDDRKKLAAALRGLPTDSNVKIIARKTRTVHDLSGTKATNRPALGCRPINHLHDAVNAFRRSDMTGALMKAIAAVSAAIFGTESPTNSMLLKRGVDVVTWKAGIVTMLLNIHADKPNEDLFDWGCRAKRELEGLVTSMGWVKCKDDWACPLRKPAAKLKNIPLSRHTAALVGDADMLGHPVATVHGAKGETHDATVLYIPKVTEKDCPANTWWSDDLTHKEERRIAFVAASRPRHLFILCAHANTVSRLRKNQAEFVRLFREVPLDANLSNILKSIYSEARLKVGAVSENGNGTFTP